MTNIRVFNTGKKIIVEIENPTKEIEAAINKGFSVETINFLKENATNTSEALAETEQIIDEIKNTQAAAPVASTKTTESADSASDWDAPEESEPVEATTGVVADDEESTESEAVNDAPITLEEVVLMDEKTSSSFLKIMYDEIKNAGAKASIESITLATMARSVVMGKEITALNKIKDSLKNMDPKAIGQQWIKSDMLNKIGDLLTEKGVLVSNELDMFPEQEAEDEDWG